MSISINGNVKIDIGNTPGSMKSIDTSQCMNGRASSDLGVHSSIFLHDSTLLTVHPIPWRDPNGATANCTEALPDDGQVTLTFRHVGSVEQNSEWTVLTSFKLPYTSFGDVLTVKIGPSGVGPSLKEYMKSLWCTLYWYFQLPRPSAAVGAKPGAPKKEWKVVVRVGEGCEAQLYEAERMGLVYSSSTSAWRGGAETFYSYSKSFWQTPPDIFYQPSDNIHATYPHALQFSLPSTNGRHPLRPKPPAPGTTFYRRYIPSLNSFLTFRTANLETDIPILHKWMNNPRVDAFWGEAGLETHQHEFLRKVLEDNHSFPVIGSWRDLSATDSANGKEGLATSGEEEPFGYFEIYWVKEDSLAGYTEAADWDRGVHVLVGEEKFRGSHRVKVWFSSLVHCKFPLNFLQAPLTDGQICSFPTHVL